MTSGEPIKLTEIPVTELLPQRPPFVMIDCLTGFSETTTETRLTVRDDNVLVQDGRLSVYGLVENIAQTCAARLGYASYILHKPVRIGFIGAVRGCKIKRLPLVGETLETRIEVKEEIFGLTLVDAEVRLDGETIAETQMKIALEKEQDTPPEAHE
ncbi:MAG: pseudouridylate synthase [Alloprevotella sp.]